MIGEEGFWILVAIIHYLDFIPRSLLFFYVIVNSVFLIIHDCMSYAYVIQCLVVACCMRQYDMDDILKVGDTGSISFSDMHDTIPEQAIVSAP